MLYRSLVAGYVDYRKKNVGAPVVLPGVKDVAVKAESEEAVKPEAVAKPEAAAPGSAAAAAQGPVGAPAGS
ncbi:MAG: hypothetical protein JNK56_11970 [Myxococcales bacterium]|nr:hypothetical protein [Myxococcales bacterium]